MIFCIFILIFSCSVAHAQLPDNSQSPKIEACYVDGKQVHLEFSKPLLDISAPLSNFFIIDERLQIEGLNYSNDYLFITLLLASEMKCGFRHQLTVKGFKDTFGNMMRDTTVYISTPCKAEPYDIVINEIMANPSNPVRLPEFEYVELYNRSDKNIEIGGWTFQYGTTQRTIPSYLFPAGGYLLLATETAVPHLSGYGVCIPAFTSATTLTNTGQYLQLLDVEKTVISWVEYNSDWYGDPLKSNGGWSLEQINPDMICSLESNWKASTSRNGGTPGQENSVHSLVPEFNPSEIIRIATPDNYTLILYVSNPLGSITPNSSQFVIKPKVTHVEIVGNHYDQLKLQLEKEMQENEEYDLTVNGSITDCAGYEVLSKSFHFQMPQYIDSLDVVINEILFNPVSDGYAFVELYNRSQKAVRVNDLQLSLRNNNGVLSTPDLLTDEPFLLLPGHYLVVSRNVEQVMRYYNAVNRSAFVQMRGMPALTRTSGRLVLLNKSLNVIDEVHYNSSQHVDFLNIANGVSLERVNPDRSSFDPGNWHTAAQTAGFATPGEKNSQYIDLDKTNLSEVSLSPECFSPDNDQIDDILVINYSFDNPSLMGEVIIFDSAGRIIKRLVNNQLLASEGAFFWDGSDDKGRRALTGVYIVFFHAFNSNGVQKVYKLPCVLAERRK